MAGVRSRVASRGEGGRGMAEGKGRLTDKMRAFADRVVAGSPSLTKAYLEIYGSGDGDRAPKKWERNEASRLWRSSPVVDYVESIRSRVEAAQSRRALGQRQRITEALWVEAQHAGKASDRIAALRLLGQQSDVGMFSEKLEVSHRESEISDAEMVAEIENTLREALAERETNTIDVTPAHAEQVEATNQQQAEST